MQPRPGEENNVTYANDQLEQLGLRHLLEETQLLIIMHMGENRVHGLLHPPMHQVRVVGLAILLRSLHLELKLLITDHLRRRLVQHLVHARVHSDTASLEYLKNMEVILQ
jgi:hypothetical protein